MVQMKAEKDIVSSKELADFISHMVQMKVSVSPFGSVSFDSLYPTWFR